MKLPHFLIIGAMKAGTTSLYRDLLTHDRVFMPVKKEPHNLVSDDVLTAAGLAAYAEHFAASRDDQLRGEASTGYSKLPDHPGVPGRAVRVLGRDLRAIYLVREPVSRVISHHYHALTFDRINAPIDRAVRSDPMFINWSLYAMQARPWIDALGPDRVRIVVFEEYVAARRDTVAELSRFLGLDPRPELIDPGAVYNQGENKPVPKGAAGVVQRNALYRRFVRPLLTPAAKDRLRRAFFPKARPRPRPPTPETVAYIIDRVRADADELRRVLGRDRPVWDFEAVARSHAARDASPAAPAGRGSADGGTAAEDA